MMNLRLLTIPLAVTLTSCASVTPYAPASDTTARVRLVAQGGGNAYFAVARELKCNRKFGNALGDGDQLISVVGGVTNNFPKFGSPVVLGMPGAKSHPEWTYVEVKLDAERAFNLRTSFVLQNGLNPADVRTCDSVSTLQLERGADYEVVFSANPKACTVAVAKLREEAGQVARQPLQPVAGPQSCTAG